MRAVLPGAVLGVLLSLSVGKTLQAELFGLRATDALTLTTIAILLVCTATLASVVAARRASSVDPITALHEA